MKTLRNTDQDTTQSNVKDVVFFGDDLFVLLSKASNEAEGWMKSTKAMDCGNGCVVQVSTQQRNPDGSYALAEATTFVPDVTIEFTSYTNGKPAGRRLVSHYRSD